MYIRSLLTLASLTLSMHATAAEDKSSTELHLSSHSMAEVVPITVTGGVGAVYLPTLNVQSEFHTGAKTHAVLGAQLMYTPTYMVGTMTLTARPYLTGGDNGGFYMNAGAHAGLGGIVFAGLFIGAGPHLGLGGKWTTKQGLVIDMNAGVTGLITHYSPGEFGMIPIPTASITFGQRLKKRR